MRSCRGLSRLVAATVASVFASAASAVPFTDLLVYGDSLSDTGNAAIAVDSGAGEPDIETGSRAPVPIPSPEYVPDRPYPSDRLSNGPVWVEGLATGLGLSATASLAGGTGFAVGARRARSGPGLRRGERRDRSRRWPVRPLGR